MDSDSTSPLDIPSDALIIRIYVEDAPPDWKLLKQPHQDIVSDISLDAVAAYKLLGSNIIRTADEPGMKCQRPARAILTLLALSPIILYICSVMKGSPPRLPFFVLLHEKPRAERLFTSRREEKISLLIVKTTRRPVRTRRLAADFCPCAA